MPVRPSEEEEKHFHEVEQQLLARMRGEEQADSEARKRWEAMAVAVGSSDRSIGHRLEQLGFNPETAPVVFFCPIVEVAWADGKVGYEESYRLVDEIRKRGFRATSTAYDMLNALTLKRPTPEFFEGCTGVLKDLLKEMSGEHREYHISNLAELITGVAQASRGFFGFGPKVTEDERATIRDIVRDLNLEQSPTAVQILSKL